MINQNGLGTVLCTTSMNAEPAMDQEQMGMSIVGLAADHSVAMILSLRTCKIVESQRFKGISWKPGSQNYSHFSNRVPCGGCVKPRLPWRLQEDGVPGTSHIYQEKLHRARQPKRAAKWTAARMAMRVKPFKPLRRSILPIQRPQGNRTMQLQDESPKTVTIIFVLCKLANQDRYQMSDTELRWKVRHAGI